MEIKIAPMDLGQEPQVLQIESLLQKQANKKEDVQGIQIMYFDKQNSNKDLQKAKAFLESKGKIVYINEVRYGLDAKDFIYEFRIL